MHTNLLRISTAFVALLIGVAFAACNESTDLDAIDPVTGVTTVNVEDNHFEEPVIQVPAGTEVTWEFTGSRPHDVAGDGWSSEVQRDGTFSFRFDEPGTYDYTCTLHNDMDGRVIVTAGEGS